MFEFWIDSVLYDSPLNWKEFTETIDYDDQLNVFLFKYENKLNFSGSAFNYLYTTRNNGGICGVSELIIKKKCSDGASMLQIFKGSIFLSDCTFFINRCIVECSIHDNNYSAKVFNNKSIAVQLQLSESKNGVTMPNEGGGYYAGQFYLNEANYLQNFVYLFNPANGAFVDGVYMKIYLLHDVFNYLVYYLTDGECSFRSDTLNYLLPIVTEQDKIKNISITNGLIMRRYVAGFEVPPVVTFEQLFKEVNKKYPIMISVEYETSGKPIIRIESTDFYRQDTPSITINNVDNVKEKSDNALLYGSIKVGSQNDVYDATLHSYIPVPFIQFGTEHYYLTGLCNTATEKDLYGEYVCDTNVVEELIVTNVTNSNFDSTIIFLEITPSTGTISAIYDCVKTANYNDPTKYHFNDNLLNINVVKRNKFLTNISNAVAGLGTTLANDSTITLPIALGSKYDCAAGSPPVAQTSAHQTLNTFNIDNGTVFDGTNYTAVVAGYYSFQERVCYSSFKATGGACPPATMNRKFTLTTLVKRYNVSSVLQETLTFTDADRTSVGNFSYDLDYSFIMNIGDYCYSESYYVSQPVDYTLDSGVSVIVFNSSCGYLTTTATPNNGVNNSANSGLNYVSNIITFNHSIPEQQYQLMKGAIYNSIQFNIDGVNNKLAWIKNTSRTLATGEMTWNLISNITNSQ